MAVALKEIVEKAATKKGSKVKGAKATRKKNEWWDKEFKQLKKEAVKGLRKWKKTKINRNSFVEAKRRERTEKE
jgi:5-methylcytosine-specific restriction endonuclease McrBC GTP-binding regulatory subunit McrB